MKKTFFAAAAFAVLASAYAFPAAAQQPLVPGQNYQQNTQSTTLTVDTGACKEFTTRGASAIFGCFLGYLNYASIILLALAVFFTIYSAFKLVRSEDGREEAKKSIGWGIVAIFVMTSVWGLVNILAKTFDVSSGNQAQSPVQLVAPIKGS